MLRFSFAALACVVLLSQIGGGSARAGQGGCTAEKGQAYIGEGRYDHAIREFTCVINEAPGDVEGYRGRIEARIFLGRYSEAMGDYALMTALGLTNAKAFILDYYGARLRADPQDIGALTGASFARWVYFDYSNAHQLLNRLLNIQPNNQYGVLFRGSTRMLSGSNRAKGAQDLEAAILLAPNSPDVRFIIADAYTYGQPDAERALFEALLALEWGLDTPRVHAILGAAYNELGDTAAAAEHIQRHFELVTTELVAAPPLLAGDAVEVDIVAGRTVEIPLPATAGESISVATSSHDYFDTILLLIAPDGSLVLGSDDVNGYFAAFTHTATTTGTYRMHVTFFECVNIGVISIARK